MKRLSLIFVFLFSAILSCNDEEDPAVETQQPPLKEELKDFSSIKTDNWRSKIGEEVTVEGYLIPVSKRIFKIVNDSSYARLNTIVSSEKYILIQLPSDPHLDSYDDLMKFTGAKVKATGLLAEFQPRDKDGESLIFSQEIMGPKSMATITLKTLPLEVGQQRIKMASKELKDLFYMTTIKILPENRTKFALLYSGGIDATQAYAYYYNNLRIMYELLLTQGYARDNIVVVYKEGVHESIVPMSLPPYFKYYPEIPVYQPATPDGLDNAIGYLRKIMKGQKAELFLMTSNHGGGYHSGENRNYSGQTDSNSDEPASDMQKLDEIASYYNTSAVISDDDFAAKINSLPFVAFKGLFLQCFSGGFINDFKGDNRVLISATTENEYSGGGGSADMDVFFRNFITPVYLANSVITSMTVDLDNDGKLTMYEIFLFARGLQQADAKKYPQYKQSPQYDDNGDGIPNEPTATGFGSKITL